MNEGEFKRRLSAILSADVEGYSRLMGEDEEATIRTLKIYMAAIRDLVQRYRGRVVDSPGDNMLAEYASVLDAVNCAVEIQRELAERNMELPENRRMQFRIGVNLGDIVEDGERIYGDGVNIAARMEGLAEGGGICISGTVCDHVKHKVGLEYEYRGKQKVKNIQEPVRVYKILSFPGAAAHRVVKAKKVAKKTWHKMVFAIAAILVIGSAAAAVWYFQLRPEPPQLGVATEQTKVLELPDRPSIAVLPFVNVGGDVEQEYFSDGMTDDLITDLSKVSGLFVISRNSVFTYKNKSVKVQRVAQELGVRYVLEGSIRRAGKQVRINAQLIDATKGHHLWADRYDGDISDVFGLQDRITGEIVAALAVKLTSGEQEQLARKETDNTEAYDALLQGQAHYVRRTPDDYERAVYYFKKAIGLDPSYGRAYGALALTYWESAYNFWTFRLGLSWIEARDSAEKYLELAMKNMSPLAHQVSSKMLINSHNYEKAIAEAQRAIALDPNDANSYLALAYALIYAGRPEEAVDLIQKAMRLDPHYPAYHLYVLGLAHFVMEEFDVAVPLFQRAIELNPEDYIPLIPLAAAYAYLGRGQEAEVTIQKLQKSLPIIVTLSTFRRHPLLSYKDPTDQDRLLAGLRKAGMPETPFDALRKSMAK